jgi:hypothetical protein
MNRHDEQAFFARLGFTGNQPLVERRENHIVPADSRPPDWMREYRTAHRARRLTAADVDARLEAIEARSRELDEMVARLG